MKKIIYTIVILVLSSLYINAQNDVLYRVSSSIEIEPYTTGYINSKGDTIIPIGKYVYCDTNIFDKIAFVGLKDQHGIFAINREEKVLFQVKSYDNGSDPIRNGLFRIVENNKIGYANMRGEIVIKPQFDVALPFEYGYASVCFGGYDETKGDYNIRVGGKWGLINSSGVLIIKPVYEAIRIMEDGKAKVKQNGEWKIIDLK